MCNYAQRLTACVHLNRCDRGPIRGRAPGPRILLKVCHMFRRSILRAATQLVALPRSFSSFREHVVRAVRVFRQAPGRQLESESGRRIASLSIQCFGRAIVAFYGKPLVPVADYRRGSLTLRLVAHPVWPWSAVTRDHAGRQVITRTRES